MPPKRRTVSRLAAGIRSLRDIPELADAEIIGGIEKLNVHGNSLTTLEYLPVLPSLKELVLSSNDLSSLAWPILGSLPQLVTLDVSCNQLTSFEGMVSMASLRRLVVAYNPLKTLEGLEVCWGLEALDLRGGGLGHSGALQSLSALTCLQEVQFQESNGDQSNPICSTPGYTSTVLNLAPALQKLDGKDAKTLSKGPIPEDGLSMPKFDEAMSRFRSRLAPSIPRLPSNNRVDGGISENSAVTTRLQALQQQARIHELETQVGVLADLAEKMYGMDSNRQPPAQDQASDLKSIAGKERKQPDRPQKSKKQSKSNSNPWNSEASDGPSHRYQQKGQQTALTSRKRSNARHGVTNEAQDDTGESSEELQRSNGKKNILKKANQRLASQASDVTGAMTPKQQHGILHSVGVQTEGNLHSVGIQTEGNLEDFEKKSALLERELSRKVDLEKDLSQKQHKMDDLLARYEQNSLEAIDLKKKALITKRLQQMTYQESKVLQTKLHAWRIVVQNMIHAEETHRKVTAAGKYEKEKAEAAWHIREDSLKSTMQAQISELKKKVTLLTAEMEEWKHSSEKYRVSERKLFEEAQDLRRVREALSCETSALKREVERCRKNEAEARAAEGEALSLQQRAEVRAAQLAAHLEAERAGQESALGAKEAQLKAELDAIRRSEQKTREENARLLSELSFSEGQTRSLDDQITELKNGLARQRRGAEDEIKRLHQNMASKIRALQQTLEGVTKQFHDARAAHKAALTEAKIAKKTIGEVSGLVRQQKSQLKLNKQEKANLEKEREDLELKVGELERRIEDLREIDEHAQRNLERLNSDRQATIDEATKKIKCLEEQVALKSKETNALKESEEKLQLALNVKTKMLDDNNVIVNELKKKDADARARYERKKNEWRDERYDLESELEAYRAENNDLKAKAEAQSEIEAHLQTIVNELKGYPGGRNETSLRDSVLSEEPVNDTISDLNEQIAEKDRALRYVEKELLSMRKLFAEKEASLQQVYSEEKKKLEMQAESLSSDLGIVRDSKRKMETQIKALENEGKSKMQELYECQSLLVKAESELQAHESIVQELTVKNSRLQEKIEAMGAIFKGL